MRSLINLVIVYHEHIIKHPQIVTIQNLATHISNAHIDPFPLRVVFYPPNQLWLRIEKHQFFIIFDVIEGDTTHGTSVTKVLARKIKRGYWVCIPRLYQFYEF